MDRELTAERTGALSGLRVVDFGQSPPGAQATQLLADFGAEVVHVEPPGGSPLRAQAAWPFLARGKRSIEVDLHQPKGLAAAHDLAASADVVLESFRLGVADRLGLGYAELAKGNPGLIYASITGFPASGPYAGVPGYEPLVMARSGAMDQFAAIVDRPGPVYISTPYCGFSASQTALHGILAALHERSRSGHGQHVRTSLLHGLAALGTYNWFLRIVARQFPEAFQAVERWDENGTPRHSLFFRLIIGLTADGRWLQFSQTQPRLFDAFVRALGLDWMKSDPKWSTLPEFEDSAQRDEFWTILLERIRAKTHSEWQEVFEDDPDVWAEVFRSGLELLDHPQLTHGKWVAEVEDPDIGKIRQPGVLVGMSGTPARLGGPPKLDEAAGDLPLGPRQAPGNRTAGTQPPLEGVTVLELGTFFAAPYGGCLLADLGARVIKIEPLAGEPLRAMFDFPDAGAAKVLQGKESVALDLRDPDGLRIVHELARRSDIVLQTFRSGAAERLCVDQATLRALNPDLIYLNAPGYGVDGPCGDKPAFAPTIAAGSGMGRRNAGPGVPTRTDMSIEDIKRYSRRLHPAVAAECAQPDGLAAMAVATAMLLGLVARDRGHGGQAMITTMLSSAMHTLSDEMVDYAGVPDTPQPDADLYGLSALYRLYETADGWVFLAAPNERDWIPLTENLGQDGGVLAGDPRFGTSTARNDNDGALAGELAKVFRTDGAVAWEQRLLAVGVGCVRVAEGPVEAQLQSEELGQASGILVDVVHPLFSEHPRLTALASFSRSTTVTGPAPGLGDHSDSVLGELGFDDTAIADLRGRGVIR